jgi:Zn-dependent peptidase ImmA (M78 family)/DNA-binding XRE family transcriptional regulator
VRDDPHPRHNGGSGDQEAEDTVSDAGFEPGRIRLARELNGWSQTELARRVDLSAAAVSQFEIGVTRPSAESLRDVAGALHMPESFFSLPLVETHEGFFRSLRRSSVTDRRRARALAQLAHDLADLDTASVLPAVTVPEQARLALDATTEEIEAEALRVRKAWGLPAGPVHDVVGVMESHGIVVIRLPLDSADVDAFSLPFADRPVVVLASDKADRARSRFDAAHELAHLVLHGEQVWGLPEVEKQAHAFAAAFLMPRDDISGELPPRADWPVLFALKQRWQVSIAALLMRARTLGRMSETSYLTAMKMVSARGWRRSEPVPLGPPEEPRLLSALVEGREHELAEALPIETIQALVGATAGVAHG